MPRNLAIPKRRRLLGGFTLVEILVVLVIVLLLSVAIAAAIPGAVRERRINEAARALQAYLEQARDAAIRANAPRGVRLLPDFDFNGASPAAGVTPRPFAFSRMIMIEPAPNYSEGSAWIPVGIDAVVSVPYTVPFPDPYSNPLIFPVSPMSLPLSPPSDPRLQVYQLTYQTIGGVDIPLAPTGWYWNIKQGDQIQFGNSGEFYTIAGPNIAGNDTKSGLLNPERYVNFGPNPGTSAPTSGSTPYLPGWTYQSPPFVSVNLPYPFNQGAEVLYLVNGHDDNGNGFVDESFDGVDNDGDGVTDPGFDGIDNNGDGWIDDPYELLWSVNGYTGGEYEQEQWIGPARTGNQPYFIKRRPYPVASGNPEVTLPAGVVIDATTINSTITAPERSRLPVDAYTGYVDIMFNPSGEVTQQYASATSAPQTAFYHFWLAEREDVYPAMWGYNSNQNHFNPNPNAPTAVNLLPMPPGAINYNGTSVLKGGRRLLTIFPKSGLIVTNAIENFSVTNLNAPYGDAQLGTRELK